MKKYDLIVIGSGPGGYVAAIRAAQLKLKTAIVERSELGGICLNWGCIPTKSLLKSAEVLNYVKYATEYGIKVNEPKASLPKMVERSRTIAQKMNMGIQFLLKKNGVKIITGKGKIKEIGKVEVIDNKQSIIFEAENIIIATGARAKELPNLKFNSENVFSYRDALTLKDLPKKMLIVGAGAIGVEFAYLYNTLGVEVTIVEFSSSIIPLEDVDISKQLALSFKKRGIHVLTNSKVISIDKSDNKTLVNIEDSKGKSSQFETDVVLSAVGVTANIENIGLEDVGVEVVNGKITVDEYYQTSVKRIYAIGDVINTPALAHVASAEGICCVEKITGTNDETIDYENIPACIYTTPEVASVGLTEKQAKEKYDIKVGKFPLTASGKATTSGATEGFIKLIFDKKYGELLGAHMIGKNVTEMIAELVMAKKLETTTHEIIKAIHPHPTISEAIMEAAAAADGEVIHM